MNNYDKILNRFTADDSGPAWISVEDELPEMRQRVLAIFNDGWGRPTVHITRRIYHDLENTENPEWHWTNTHSDKIVTHWMPIPELPQLNNNTHSK